MAGIMDRLKGLLKGREQQVKSGIDKASDVVEKRLPKHAHKVENAAGKAKGAVDKLSGDDRSASTGTTTPTTPSTPSPSPSTSPTPPASPTTPPETPAS